MPMQMSSGEMTLLELSPQVLELHYARPLTGQELARQSRCCKAHATNIRDMQYWVHPVTSTSVLRFTFDRPQLPLSDALKQALLAPMH